MGTLLNLYMNTIHRLKTYKSHRITNISRHLSLKRNRKYPQDQMNEMFTKTLLFPYMLIYKNNCISIVNKDISLHILQDTNGSW